MLGYLVNIDIDLLTHGQSLTARTQLPMRLNEPFAKLNTYNSMFIK